MLVHTFFLHLAEQLGAAHQEEEQSKSGRFNLVQNPNADDQQLLLFKALVTAKNWLHKELHVSDLSPMTPYIIDQLRRAMLQALGNLERTAILQKDREKFAFVEATQDVWHEFFEEFVSDFQHDSTPAA